MEITCFQTEKRFIFFEDSPLLKRTAEITFKRQHGCNKFTFDKCVFNTRKTTYDLGDWTFLGNLAAYIAGLNKAASGEDNG